jgi:hypothetical protein
MLAAVSAAGTGGYDPVELRRRIAVCFSVGELRALAESLGVGGVTWDRGLDEAAREVVRQSQQYAGLPALVARLRELRPLVEWPEASVPEIAAVAPVAPVAPIAPGVAAPTLASAAPPAELASATLTGGPPLLAASPGTFGGPAVSASALVAPAPQAPRASPDAASFRDPYAPPPGPPAIHVPPPPPPSAAPPSAGWPGTTAPPAPVASRGIDPRVLVLVAGLMLLAAIVAFLAGRAGSGTAPQAATASAAPRAPGMKGDGPAAAAADAIARSYANLARVCELPASAGGNELVFRRAFERCGPGAPARRAGASPAPTSATTADTATSPDAPPTRTARPSRDPGAAPAPARGCIGTCDTQHAACRARCGGEPTESSAYDVYQRCLGRCLSDASRCRLSCR